MLLEINLNIIFVAKCDFKVIVFTCWMFFTISVYESFKEYIAVETLEGDNKYDAGEYGLQVSNASSSVTLES